MPLRRAAEGKGGEKKMSAESQICSPRLGNITELQTQVVIRHFLN